MANQPKQLHPLTWLTREATSIFAEKGFEIVEGPEVTTEKYNFDSLNVPEDHPSRDAQDTFWLNDGRVLQTHTTSMQLPIMEERKPPVRIVVPGRCFRNEATDASHETTFYQLDGFVIDREIDMAQLVTTLKDFLRELFGQETEIRTRPHFYPFVEPGMDIDLKLKGKWQEVLGSGLIHPIVLKNMKLDPNKYSGFAFGMGIDRLMMLKFGVADIRLSYSSDLRFLKQFQK